MFNDDFLRQEKSFAEYLVSQLGADAHGAAYEDPTHRCTRYAGHDGPCNGLPCDTALAKMSTRGVDVAANPDGSNKPTKWRFTVKAMDALGPNDHLLTGEPLATTPEHAMADIWNLLAPECDPCDWAGIREAVADLVRQHKQLRLDCIEALQRPSLALVMINRVKDGW